MKKIRKILGCALSVVFVFCTAACASNDKSWALKSDKYTVPNGVYVYYLFDAYNSAIERISMDGSGVENIETQTIEDKSATEWIRDEAIESCKNMIAIEKMFDDAGISLSDQDTENIDQTVESFWSYSGERVEKYGISKDDFRRAYPTTSAKSQKLFNSIYGKDGSNAVSDEDLLNFYKSTYMKISLFSKVSEESLSEGEDSFPNTNATKTDTQIEEQFKGYVDMVNSGTKSAADVAGMFKQAENLEMDPLETEVINPDDSDISEEISNTLKSLEVGKATYTKYSDTFIFLYKNDIGAENPDLSDESVRDKILQGLKSKEFESSVATQKNGMKIEINDSSIKDYPPVKTFEES